jgi:hypothetical protein
MQTASVLPERQWRLNLHGQTVKRAMQLVSKGLWLPVMLCHRLVTSYDLRCLVSTVRPPACV